MKPFLKWAGNKYRITGRIKSVLPPGKRLIEPFAGSAALFLNSCYSEYLLADSNLDLIQTFIHLQKEGQEFIAYCQQFFINDNNQESVYYEFREKFNATSDPRLKSALFIYLNRHCFNGLCRYNSKGQFNTPFGRYKTPYFPRLEMEYFHQKSQTAIFAHNSFLDTFSQAKLGDVVYCDPPYVPLTKTANFTSYDCNGFGLEQQQLLANQANILACKGIPVIISNHWTEFTEQAYKNAEIFTFPVQRFISCKGDNRNSVTELLAIFNNKTPQIMVY